MRPFLLALPDPSLTVTVAGVKGYSARLPAANLTQNGQLIRKQAARATRSFLA